MTEKQIQKKRESMPKVHERFANLLREGKEQATLMSDIMSVLNIQDRRQAYQIVEDLINKYHYPIGANRSGEHRGYFLISTEDELEEVVTVQRASVESEMKKIDNTIRNFRSISKVMERSGAI